MIRFLIYNGGFSKLKIGYIVITHDFYRELAKRKVVNDLKKNTICKRFQSHVGEIHPK